MANSISETNRLFSFDSPLGSSLLCNSFAGTEEISELFHFNLELVSEDFNIDWQQLLNKNVTVGIRLSDNSFRYFNGYIIRFEPTKPKGRLGYYKAEMVPWLWFLTQTQNCIIYQDKTVVEVIKATFDNAGFSGQYDVSKLGDRHAPWINCCQYRETAFDFISRLAEIEGIYYYFKHEQGKHTLMMVDHLSAHLPNPFQPTVEYAHDEGGGVLRTTDTITDCDMGKTVKPSKYAHKDYNFLIPNASLYHEGDVHKTVSGSRILEIYDYPGEFEWPKDAPDWGALRQEELEFDHAVITGSGTVRALSPGYRVDINNIPRTDLNNNYLITKVTHHAHEGSFGAGFDSYAASYDNSFSAIPSSVQFRPTRKTDTPDVSSIQTATVVGPPGEEIYTDEYGRVKVHFHWDRTKASENSSCWIRVMQPWAGPNWGHIWIPRVGMEVMIQFLEGDPDRPVITGCFYNEENRPPYKLPAKKNWSGIMTRSTKGGKMNDFNEIRFDDTMGSELMLMHAQKDMQITVANDTIESIKRDRTLNVKRNQIEQVEADKHATVKGNFNQKVVGNVSQTVGGNIAVNSGGDIVLRAQGNICIVAGGVINLTAAGGITMSPVGGGGGMGGGGTQPTGSASSSGATSPSSSASPGGATSNTGSSGGIGGASGGAMGASAAGAVSGAGSGPAGGATSNSAVGGGTGGAVGGAAAGAGSGMGSVPAGGATSNSAVGGAAAGAVSGTGSGAAGGAISPNLASEINAITNALSNAVTAGGSGGANLSASINAITNALTNAVAGGAQGAAASAINANLTAITNALTNAVTSAAAGGGPASAISASLTANINSVVNAVTNALTSGGAGGAASAIAANLNAVRNAPPTSATGGAIGGAAGAAAGGAAGTTGTGAGVSGGAASTAGTGAGAAGGAASTAGTGAGAAGAAGASASTGASAAGGATSSSPNPSSNAPSSSNSSSGGGLPGAGSCFISVNSSGIIIQGSPMVYLNCNMPAPQGTCTHTPIVPMLPDLSKLAPDINLGGAANPAIAGKASGSGGSGAGSASGTGSGGTGSVSTAGGSSGSGSGSASGTGAGSSGTSSSTLASNQWVNPNSTGGTG